MPKTNLMGYTQTQLEDLFAQIGEKPYRGKQLFKWLYNNRLFEFDLMTDLSKDLRQKLDDGYELRGLTLDQRRKSLDGPEKFLFRLDDGNPVESVLIPDGDRTTACISSQSGCALACKFCATGTMGLLRDLTVGEIIGQLVYLREVHGTHCFTNVVFMGMGEPLNNYGNLIEALEIMSSLLALGIAAKRITVSTSGVTPKIRKLADSKLKVRLALSLHAATQEKRLKIMPIAETFGLEKLMETVKYYTEVTGYRVTFEYVLLEGFNDTREDIKALIKLVHGIPCKVNLLAYNPVPGLEFKRPSDEKVNWFARELFPHMGAVTVRKSRGKEIDAACGQLAARHYQ